MKSIAIIPARMGSSRFPGKPMFPIAGMPMIGHCYHRTKMAKGIHKTVVATCDEEIEAYMKSIGGDVVMTSSSHNRASDRTAEALQKVEQSTGEQFDIVVMVQGDEPLILPDSIAQMVGHFEDESLQVVNIMSRLRTREQFEDKNNVKVVTDSNGFALYFSREPIPSPWKGTHALPMYMQVGVIAFRRQVLLDFNASQEMPLEIIESVDMNRVLENGGNIKMVASDAMTIGVDTPEEAEAAGSFLLKDPIFQEYAQT